MMEEIFSPGLDLKTWASVVSRRQKIYVTDAKSVFDYCTKEGTSLSSDKRMAIEGAILKETLQQSKTVLKWIDGMQHFSDVLTKENPDWEYFQQFMRTNLVHLNQDPAAVAIKEKKKAGRAARKVTVAEDEAKKALKEKSKE